jgi:hypothetical protein
MSDSYDSDDCKLQIDKLEKSEKQIRLILYLKKFFKD